VWELLAVLKISVFNTVNQFPRFHTPQHIAQTISENRARCHHVRALIGAAAIAFFFFSLWKVHKRG
jgi:hypothetical protein